MAAGKESSPRGWTPKVSKPFEGKTIAEIAKIRGQDPVSTCFDMIYEEGMFIHGVHHTMCGG